MKNAIEVVVLVEWQDAKVAEDLATVVAEQPVNSKPAAVAIEMKTRAVYLRSRPMAKSPGLQRAEREILAELDSVEVQARMLEAQRQLGECGPLFQGEVARLAHLAFAVRRRFEGLLEALDEHWVARPQAQSPGRRAQELEEIERFLRAKKAKSTGTDGK